jgi:hypothetical protein
LKERSDGHVLIGNARGDHRHPLKLSGKLFPAFNQDITHHAKSFSIRFSVRCFWHLPGDVYVSKV